MGKNRIRWILGLCFLIFEVFLLCGIQIIIDNNLERIYENKKNIENRNQIISTEMIYFPIHISKIDYIHFEDSFNAKRGNGAHEGCDIMYDENEAGVVPVVSSTDGKITNLGWLYLGGYRIGITSPSGTYYYYAHLDSYSKSLFVGKEVKAGEFLGFMGNTGEGEEGTMGKFPVHLHFGIYIENEKKNEISVNPYRFLQKLYEE